MTTMGDYPRRRAQRFVEERQFVVMTTARKIAYFVIMSPVPARNASAPAVSPRHYFRSSIDSCSKRFRSCCFLLGNRSGRLSGPADGRNFPNRRAG